MIARIMAHEWRLLSRERVLHLALPVYALLLAYGVMSGTHWKHFLEANTAEAKRMADAGVQSKIDKLDRILAGKEVASFGEDPRVAAPYSRWKGYEMATKPPSSTAAIAVGQSDIVPSYLKVQWKAMFKQTSVDEIENPENLGIGAFDLSFVLLYLYPLLIIALSYNILSSERENGTQVLLLSQPVSVRQFVTGKILLRGLLIIGVAAGISLIGLLVGSPDIVTAGGSWRIGLLGMILVLYGAFWFGLAVVVNAFGKKSSTNALLMLAGWIAFVLVIPAALNLLARSLYPLPSRIELVQTLRKASDEAIAESGFKRPYRPDLLRKGEEAAFEGTNFDFYSKLLPLEQEGERRALPIFDRFNSQRLAQQQLTEELKYLSPAAVAQLALIELANHSAQNFNDFNAQVERYHQAWRDFFLPKVMANQLLTREEMLSVPRFSYVPEPDRIVAARLLKDLLGICVVTVLTLIAGFSLLKRYPAVAR
jgi:ABC-2 type transport system permease protein